MHGTTIARHISTRTHTTYMRNDAFTCILLLLIINKHVGALISAKCSFVWAPRTDSGFSMTRCDAPTHQAADGHHYEDTAADRTLRLFWEAQTFEATEKIMDAVIYRNESSSLDAPLLVRDDDDSLPSSEILDLFSPLYQGLPDIFSNDTIANQTTRQKRRKTSNFRLDIAYRGSHFCGFQRQVQNENLSSVQQSLEEWLATLNNNNNVNVCVCGRTDAGVHALRQVCRFRTQQQDLTAKDVLQHLQACPLVAQGSFSCLKVTRVSHSFHPTFNCQKRAYAYVMDPMDLTVNQIKRLDSMLQRLEGHELDYVALSYGRVKTETTLCTLYHCRASLVTLSVTKERVLCIELVGNRFLRRMVRILVATALRQVLNNESENDVDALLEIVKSRDRRQSARKAPPSGLIFVGAEVD